MLALAMLAGTLPLGTFGCKGIVDEKAYNDLQAALGTTSFTVFPTYIRTGTNTSYDRESASRIAAFFVEAGLGEAEVADVEVPLPVEWSHNQAAMLRETAAAFAAYRAENPVATRYAALAEILRGRADAQAGGIHWYVLDDQGRVAHAKLMNSHYVPFKTARLDTNQACTAFLIAELRRDFAAGAAAEPKQP
jgi:hypothetical protein